MQQVRWEEGRERKSERGREGGREGGQARTRVRMTEDAPRVVSEIHFFEFVGICHVKALNAVGEACQVGGWEGGREGGKQVSQ